MSDSGHEVLARADILHAFSEDPIVYSRTFLSVAHVAAAAQVAAWMRDLDLVVHVDGVGNVIGRWQGTNASAATLLTGSHYDTVRNAGRYDGVLGILVALAAIRSLKARGWMPAYSLEVIAFAEEENVRFGTSFLGSRSFIGEFDDAWWDLRSEEGVTLREVIAASNLPPIANSTRDWSRVAGYVEVHIEQGPELIALDQPLGIVSAIAGASRLLVEVRGQAGHAGTVSMSRRKDALAAAAEMILAAESYAKRNAASLVATVGQLTIPHAAANVIPGAVEFTVDIRSGSDHARASAVSSLTDCFQQIAVRRGIEVSASTIAATPAVPCDPGLVAQFRSAVSESIHVSDVPLLVSGAGHDAVILARRTAVGMLFVRCGNGGISHHPAESVSEQDVAIAVKTFAEFLTRFDPSPSDPSRDLRPTL